MKRRSFLKSLAASGVAASVAGGVTGIPKAALAKRKKEDIGECKSVKIYNLTETSWFDNPVFKKNIVENGGAMTNQYDIPWDPLNSGGYSTLIEITQLDDSKRYFQLDSGWNNKWMDFIYQKTPPGLNKSVAQMQSDGTIENMVLSHWHLDHYWGIGSTLKNKQDIKIYAPETHFPEDIKLLNGGELKAKGVSICKNDYPYKGEMVKTNTKKLYKLMPGVAVKMFDVPILLRVRGENVIYCNIKDKGIVTITGCCHPGILTLYSYAKRNFVGGNKTYGCYGGLHISLFETWDPKFDDIIKGCKAFKPTMMGCNHCTGWIWAEKAREQGLPIVQGTDKYKDYGKGFAEMYAKEYEEMIKTGKSEMKKLYTYSSVAKASNVFLTNGDTVTF